MIAISFFFSLFLRPPSFSSTTSLLLSLSLDFLGMELELKENESEEHVLVKVVVW